MKILLCAINSKYIHTNPAIHSLKAYAQARLYTDSTCPCEADTLTDADRKNLSDNNKKQLGEKDSSDIIIDTAEYTINQNVDDILAGIYRQKPDVLCFSCYIWNIAYTETVIREIKKVMPSLNIYVGGPEVSFDAENVLTRLPEVDGVMRGEGEQTFLELCLAYQEKNSHFKNIAGLTYRSGNSILSNPDRLPMSMDDLTFIYNDDLKTDHQIVYYESSRGCPFNCSYCLSSIDKHLRFRSLDKVLPELQYFLDRNIPQVKFVDRTFNCKKDHAMAIWQYILDHDNGITNFHFEIAADLISDDELELLAKMRPGQVQLEIGIQSTNLATIKEIHRVMDFNRVADVVTRIHSFGNIHQHVDLIAGLPHEDLTSFRRSFNDVYRLQGALLQLGFLKVLKGSCMAQNQPDYELVCQSRPPYEVLQTKWLSYDDVLTLKGIEEMVEVYYNSLQFTTTLPLLEPLFETPYDLFDALRIYYDQKGLFGISHKRSARYEHLISFIEWVFEKHEVPDEVVTLHFSTEWGSDPNSIKSIDSNVTLNPRAATSLEQGLKKSNRRNSFLNRVRESLTVDYYLRENAKSRPAFAIPEITDFAKVHAFYENEELMQKYLPGYLTYDPKQRRKMTHLEYLPSRDQYLLFDYSKRDPLSDNVKMRSCTLS
ncbi:MAG: B12-binding domain-containing radical SAM protein [Lachnospiraceae bacterium]|nr:B12-binding domain-containing radical SAM protein [Candidatus Equihabitans merdae]